MSEINAAGPSPVWGTIKTLLIAGLALVMIASLSLAAGLLAGMPVDGSTIGFGPPTAIAILVQNLLLLAFGLAFAPRGGERRVTPLMPAVAIGAGCGLAGSVAGIVLAALQQALGLEVEEQAWILETLGRFDLWTALLALVVVVVAPLGEESFFRRYLFDALGRTAGPVVAALLSAGMFALIHFNWSGLALYFVLGLTLAASYQLTGRLIAPVIGHALHNALTLTLGLIAARSGV